MKISILTPSYNRAELIKPAIESVLAQKYTNFEHIVIDGASTDGTLELLSSYPNLRIFSELDHGMYDALNKGLDLAQGQIIGLLNTDDIYEAGIFDEVVETFDRHSQADVVIGRALVFEDVDHAVVDEYPPLTAETLLDQLLLGVPSINAWFFRRDVFDRVGRFDQTFAIGADRDFLIRLYLAGFKPIFMEKVYCRYRRHAESLTINPEMDSKLRVFNENLRLARKYIGVAQPHSIFSQKCLQWHDLTSIELLILLLRQKRIQASFQVVRSAIQYNPKWLLLIAMQSPVRIKNYLKKNYAPNR